MVSAENLSFSYKKKTIFEGISFEVKGGQCLVIAGENGAGKSTLLSVLAGVLKPGSGSVNVKGRIGLVPQDNGIFEDMSVLSNVAFFAALSKAKAARPLPFGLEPYAKTKAAKLSGGFKKRLAIACAAVSGPDVWLFDEPCAGLDAARRSEILSTVAALKEEGRAVVYVGHDPEEFASFADMVLYLGKDSELTFCGGMDAGEIAEDFKKRLGA